MEIRSNFIEKSVFVRITGLLGIEGDFELRNFNENLFRLIFET